MNFILFYLIVGSFLSFVNCLHTKEINDLAKTIFIIIAWPIVLIVGCYIMTKDNSGD